MKTLALVHDEQLGNTVIKEFEEPITISDLLATDDYAYDRDIEQHRLYVHKPTNAQLVYKQYNPEAYAVLKKLQAILYASYYHVASTIFAISYNPDLNVIETLEQYIDGQSLADFLNTRYASIELYDLISIGINLTKLIDMLSDNNIILRDLSPQNIILDSPIEPIVIDFNTACLDNYDSYINDKPMGTIGFASPEHFETNKVTSKSDIYSLGVIFNELLNIVESDEWDHPLVIPILKELVLQMISLNPNLRPEAYTIEFVLSDLLGVDQDDELDREEILDQLTY